MAKLEPDRSEPIVVPVHYDFASTLCYVAHRVMERVGPRLGASPDDPERPPIELHWTPIDLAALLNWRRGALVPDDRRENAVRVAGELDVPARVPRRWLDSRPVMAAAIALEADARAAAAWRERVYTAIFEEGRGCEKPEDVRALGRELALRFDTAQLERAHDELERRTRAAAEAMVTGVPTFMLSTFPMRGIQEDDTMVSLLCRYARRSRERALSAEDA